VNRVDHSGRLQLRLSFILEALRSVPDAQVFSTVITPTSTEIRVDAGTLEALRGHPGWTTAANGSVTLRHRLLTDYPITMVEGP
jgi:hypothetical protein